MGRLSDWEPIPREIRIMNNVAEIQNAVKEAKRIRVRGGGSKPALSLRRCADDTQLLDLTDLQGITAYQPEEYTLTARAGTTLAEVAAMLEENGQYLPFDPPLADRGATLGGTVAAGLSGSGRYRYGGIRDFLIGIRFIDGRGQEIRGGGTVVKNAAGFDFPKLFVGSLGRLGILTELTFKVFPRPPAFATVEAQFDALSDLLAGLNAVTGSAIDLHAVDFAPTEEGWRLWVRIGGLEPALEERALALQEVIVRGAERTGLLSLYRDNEDDILWREARSMDWLTDGTGLVRIPLTPGRIPAAEEMFGPAQTARRRYSVGGNLLWLGWPNSGSVEEATEIQNDTEELHAMLLELGLQGIQLFGRGPQKNGHSKGEEGPLLGRPVQNVFLRRIAAALDPEGKFETW